MARVEGLHLWPPHTSASLTAQQVMRQNTSRKSINWGILVTIISELTIDRSAWREGNIEQRLDNQLVQMVFTL